VGLREQLSVEGDIHPCAVNQGSGKICEGYLEVLPVWEPTSRTRKDRERDTKVRRKNLLWLKHRRGEEVVKTLILGVGGSRETVLWDLSLRVEGRARKAFAS